MINWFLSPASTFAPAIDSLILLIAVVVGAWFIAAELVLVGLIVKFRARHGVRARYIAGDDKREKRWVSYPHHAVLVFDIIIIAAALHVWHVVKVTPPPAEDEVRIISQQWAWTFVLAGPDGRLDTPDDIRTVDDLYVQRDRVYHFELHSRDVVHSFSIPAFRLKQDAVPGRVIRGWFKPTMTGTFDIQCAEMCGLGHALMPGHVHIGTAEQHAAWMNELALAPYAKATPAALAATAAANGGHEAHAGETQ